jgi:hypothetical protein
VVAHHRQKGKTLKHASCYVNLEWIGFSNANKEFEAYRFFKEKMVSLEPILSFQHFHRFDFRED